MGSLFNGRVEQRLNETHSSHSPKYRKPVMFDTRASGSMVSVLCVTITIMS